MPKFKAPKGVTEEFDLPIAIGSVKSFSKRAAKLLGKSIRKGRRLLTDIQSGAKSTPKAFGAREREIQLLKEKLRKTKGSREVLRQRLPKPLSDNPTK